MPLPDPIDLCDAWIKVAVASIEQGAHLTLQLISNLGTYRSQSFWWQIACKLATEPPNIGGTLPTEVLLAQWESLRVDLSEYLKAYTRLWTLCRKCSRNADACREIALSSVWRSIEFRGSLDEEDEIRLVVKRLVGHEKWWSILKPLIMEVESVSGHVGAVRSRSYSTGEDGRRVQRRLNPQESHSSPMSTIELPERHQTDTTEQQRLEFEIMRQSEEGLSEDAVEYLRLKRKQILKKLQEETKEGEE